MGNSRAFFFPALVLLLAGAASATTSFNSTCGLIPDASGPTAGSLSCWVQVTSAGLIPTGNAITVSFVGFQHEASGDLVATLTHFGPDHTTVLGTQSVFARIGQSLSLPFGYDAQFGDTLAGTGDTYHFNSGFTGDLWAEAAARGLSESIPGEGQNGSGDYAPTDPGSSAPNLLSSAFAGQALAGYWQIDILDMAEGPTGFPGSLDAFTIDFQTDVPEPRLTAPIAILTAAGWFTMRRRKSV